MAILKMGDGINKDRFRLNNSFSPLTPPMMLLILQKTDMEPLDLEWSTQIVEYCSNRVEITN